MQVMSVGYSATRPELNSASSCTEKTTRQTTHGGSCCKRRREVRGATPFAHAHGPPQGHSRCMPLPGRDGSLRRCIWAEPHRYRLRHAPVVLLLPAVSQRGQPAAVSQPARSASAVSQRGQPARSAGPLPQRVRIERSLCALIRSILTVRACFVQGSSSSSCPEL